MDELATLQDPEALEGELATLPDYDDDDEVPTMSNNVFRGGRGGSYDARTGEYRDTPSPPPSRKPAASPFRAEDHIEATKHMLADAFGVPVKLPHPIAAATLREGPPFTLNDAAETALEMAGYPLKAGEDPYREILAASMNTSTFPAIIEETWRGVARARRSPLLDKLLLLTHQLQVRDYKAQSFSMVDLAGMPAPGESTMGEWTDVVPRVTGETIQAFSLFARISISVQALVDDDRNLFRSAIAAFLRSAHSAELQKLTSMITANANLRDDNSPLFHEDHGNALTGLAPSLTTYEAAVKALRDQRTEGGDKTDADPHVILTPAEWEMQALELVKKLPMDYRPQVVATSHLPASAWYVMADPELFPVFGRVRREGAELSAVSFGPFEVNENTPGVYVPATHSVGYSVLSRVGAVRVTVD